jgi:hypothetical protein
MRPGSLLAVGISLVSHLIISVVLALIVVGSTGSRFQGFSLNGTQLEDSVDNELPSLDISVSGSMMKGEETESRNQEAPPTPLGPSSSLNEIASSTTKTPAMTSPASAESKTALMLWNGESDESMRGTGASFFGAKAYGNRFVFVIDSSSSMIGPRWEALRIELNRALRSLSEDQEFFVISFDYDAHPMFNTLPPKGKFLRPTKKNIQRVNRWIGSIDHRPSTQPASAVGMALRLNPDAIFLLSDGEIRDSTLFQLRTHNRSQDAEGKERVTVPIHTLLLHSDVGFLTLKTIAEENDGVFTPVSLFGVDH